MPKTKYNRIWPDKDIENLPEPVLEVLLEWTISRAKDKNTESAYMLINEFVELVNENKNIPRPLLKYLADSFGRHLFDGLEIKESLNLKGSKINKDRLAFDIYERVERARLKWGDELPLDGRRSKHNTSIYQIVSEEVIKEGVPLSEASIRKYHEYVRKYTNDFDRENNI